MSTTGIRRKRIYPRHVKVGIMFPINTEETKFIHITKAFVMETLASYLSKDGVEACIEPFWSFLSAEYRGDGSVMPDKCTPAQWIKRELAFWSAPDSEDDE